MNERRLRKIIQKAKEMAKKNLSIKNEIFVLSTFYDYVCDKDDYKWAVDLIDKDFDYLKSYQEKYEADRKTKKDQKLMLLKEHEYKLIWGEKSFIYKLIHRKLSPKNADLKGMVFDDIDSLINKIKVSKKK